MEIHDIIEDDYHHYAYNDKGELIHLCREEGEIPRKDYKCLACKEAMRPIMGDYRDWHFRHVVENPNCNKETYLHVIAKEIIKDRFYNSTTFNIAYHVKEICSHYDHCPGRSCLCYKEYLKTINLKEDYDTCEPEKEESNFPFRADLKLSNSHMPEQKSIFFEVAYTHDCETSKINSGIPIIELKVYEDTDIDQRLVEEPMMLDYTLNNPYLGKLPKVRFFNFERQIKTNKITKEPNCNRYWKAKNNLKKIFRQSDSFIVEYNGLKNCSRFSTCPLACEECREQKTLIKEDLKRIYDTCTEDKDGNLVLANTCSDIPSITFKFSFGGKTDYEEDKRVIEFLNYKDIGKVLKEDLMHVNLENPRNPYESQAQPSIRFYHFDRFVEKECSIMLKRFAVIKDKDSLKYCFMEDIDCHHVDDWPKNVLYGLLTPNFVASQMKCYKLYGMLMACIKGYKIYNCSICKYRYQKDGQCVRLGSINDLISNNVFDTDEECKKCDKFEIDTMHFQEVIGQLQIPLIEWKK